jgi:hypothetical protein
MSITFRHARKPLLLAAESNEIETRTKPQTNKSIQCINCTLEITDDMKLPVYKKGQSEGTDYIRIPLNYDLVLKTFDYSTFCACSAPCGLGFLFRHPAFLKNHTPDIFHCMMQERYGIQEPTIPAPSFECLQLANQWTTTVSGVDDKSNAENKSEAKAVGLSVASFYRLISSDHLEGTIAYYNQYIPPYENEHMALEKRMGEFMCGYYTDFLPECIQADFEGISSEHLEANPDSDTETDYALGTVHPVVTPVTESVESKKKKGKAVPAE